jgi:NitT/TauT family transport system substrate-binding protein
MAKVLASVNTKWAKPVVATLIILLLLSMVFPACATQEAKLSHLKVVALPYIGFATFYIPQEEGYFAEQGLDVEFVKFPTVSQAMPLLVQGELDVAYGDSASVMNAIAQNMKLRIVGGGSYFNTDCEVVSLMARVDLYESGELDTVAEVKGRKVAVGSVSATGGFMLTKILEAGGLTLGDVELVQMQPQDMIAAFENRAIDVAVVGSPSNQQIKALGYAITLESAEKVMPGFQQGVVIFGPSLLDKNPELGKKFMVAYLKGCRQYNQGKTKRNLEILEKYTGLDENTLLQSCWYPFYPDGRIKVKDILTFQDWAYDNGFVDKKITSEQLIDTRFIEYANEVLGPAP